MSNRTYFMIMINCVILFVVQSSNLYSQDDASLVNDAIDEVNLFTGDFETVINLYTLTGRNGLNFPIRLDYHSDVNDIASGDNKDKQASAHGLGWQLAIPFISTKITDVKEDGILEYSDSYVEGYKANPLIALGSNQYKLKDYRFWDVTYNSNTGAWEILTEDGTKLTFGNRRHLVWRNWYADLSCLQIGYTRVNGIGNVGYRWDLTEIQDVFGNKIIFQYDNILENVSDYLYGTDCDTTANYKDYTKASYVTKIIDETTERVVQFNWESRADYEDGYEGPGVLEDDPANNQSDRYEEFFSTQRLESIKVYDTDPDANPTTAQLIHDTRFEYDYNSYGNDPKLVLTGITRYDPDDSAIELPSIAFDYHPSGSSNPGALKQIQYPNGGKTTIVYEERAAGAGWRVDSVKTEDGLGNMYASNYEWADAQAYEDSSFYGHADVTIYRNAGVFGRVKYHHEADSSTHKLGVLNKVEYYKPLDPLPSSSVTYNWNALDKGDSSYARQLSSIATNLDGVTSQTSYDYNATNGLVSRVTDDNTVGTRYTFITYAFEESEYSDMNSRHMLSQVVERRVTNSLNSNAGIFFSQATTWKDWSTNGSGKWASEKTYLWSDNTGSSTNGFDFSQWSGAGEPPQPQNPDDPHWIRTSRILSRDSQGKMLEAEDAKGVVSATKWSYTQPVPVATFSNATDIETRFEDMEEFYTSFYGETAYAAGDYGGLNNTLVLSKSEDRAAGHYSQKIEVTASGQDAAGIVYGLATQLIPGKEYILEFDCKVEQGEMNAHVETSTAGVPSTRLDLFCTNRTWQHYKGTFTLDTDQVAGLYFRTPWQWQGDAVFYVDNVRIYPEAGSAVSQSFDLKTFQLLDVHDANGDIVYSEYDGFNRPIHTRNQKRELVAATAYSDHDISVGNPNFIQSVSFPEGNYAPNWSFEQPGDAPNDDEKWTPYWEGEVDIVDQSVVQPMFGNNVLRVIDTDGGSTGDPDGAGFTFYNGEIDNGGAYQRSDSYAYHALVGQPVTFSAWVRTATGSGTVQIGIENNGDSNFAVGTIWQRISVHFNSLAYAEPTPTADWSKRIRCFIGLTGTQTGTIYIDGVALEISDNSQPQDFIVSTSYYDGLGRPLQTQMRDGNDDIVQHSSFDALGRPDRIYRPFSLNTSHSFMEASQIPSGESSRYIDIDYQDNPLQRISQIIPDAGAPGTVVTFDYGSGVFDQQTYRFTQVTDENGNTTHEYFDEHLNRVGFVNARNKSGIYDFDAAGNIIEIEDLEGNKTKYRYNTLGQLTTVLDPDMDSDSDGNTINEVFGDPDIRYKYDNNGNLRFVQDANHNNGGNDLVFYQYDYLNRLTLVGEATLDASIPSWSNLDPNVVYTGSSGENFEDETYRLENVRVKYHYDTEPPYSELTGVWADASSPGTLRNLKGRLAAVAYQPSTGSEWGYTYYSYDEFGNIEFVVQQLPTTEVGMKQVAYGYDKLGRLSETRFNSGESDAFYIWREYDAVGHLAAIYADATANKPATPLAQYTYWPNGNVENIAYNNGRTINYTLTDRNWLDTIEEVTSFKLDLDYDPAGNIDLMSLYMDGHSGGSPDSNPLNDPQLGYDFGYDELNRLRRAGALSDSARSAAYTYDANGNLAGLGRGTAQQPQDSYFYDQNSNRLNYVSTLGQAANNYSYDPSGNLTSDASKGMDSQNTIRYDFRNLPYQIPLPSSAMYYTYDANGERVIKKFIPAQ